MTFTWPSVLIALVLIPLLVAAYIWLLRRRRKFAVRYASLSLIRAALPKRSRWRRHLPFALFLASLASLIIAAARPQAVVEVPTSRTTVLLVLDVSGSMCSTDVPPNRLTVAQQVARNFVKDRASGTKIGLLAFAGFAQVVVAPTTDKDALIKGIDGLTTGRGTAIGSALLKAIDAVAEGNANVARAGVDVVANPGPGPAANGRDFEPDVIVLLTDGATTQGVNPLVAAQQAVDRRLRIYTIGFGTTQPSPLVCTRAQLGADTFGRGGGPGGPGGFTGGGGRNPGQFQRMDAVSLQTIAEMTGGSYHVAEDADQLQSVFRGLPAEITRQEEEVEFSVAFAGLGALLAIAAVALSMAWNRYP